jgi:hypothetical protein
VPFHPNPRRILWGLPPRPLLTGGLEGSHPLSQPSKDSLGVAPPGPCSPAVWRAPTLYRNPQRILWGLHPQAPLAGGPRSASHPGRAREGEPSLKTLPPQQREGQGGRTLPENPSSAGWACNEYRIWYGVSHRTVAPPAGCLDRHPLLGTAPDPGSVARPMHSPCVTRLSGSAGTHNAIMAKQGPKTADQRRTSAPATAVGLRSSVLGLAARGANCHPGTTSEISGPP